MLSNDDCCQQLTGILPFEVKELSGVVESAKLSWKLPVISQTLLILFWLRQYVPNFINSWIFEVSESSIDRYLWEIVSTMYNHFVTKLLFPSREERLRNSVNFRGFVLVMVIDGTEQQMVCHIDKLISESTRSGKKSTNTITKMAGVNP
jgi:hypothetical protein